METGSTQDAKVREDDRRKAKAKVNAHRARKVNARRVRNANAARRVRNAKEYKTKDYKDKADARSKAKEYKTKDYKGKADHRKGKADHRKARVPYRSALLEAGR